MGNSRIDELCTQATGRIAAMLDNPPSRLTMREEFYRLYGFPVKAEKFGYGNSEIAFMQWEVARGVLNALTHERPGSKWWRKVNENLMYHAEVACLIAADGLEDRADVSRSTRFWLDYIENPSSDSWYRAHNGSIVEGYLMYIEEARAESVLEQQFMNEVLIRLLYAQAMVEGMRFAFGELGELLSDPRLPSVNAIVHLPEFYPKHYPLTEEDDDRVLYKEHCFMGRMETFFDKVLIRSHIRRLFRLVGKWIGEPRLERLLDGGRMVYPNCVI